MSNYKDQGEKSDESTSEVSASFTCQDCGKKNSRLEAHHIIPSRLNGSDSIHNLITLCSSCHEQVTGEEMALLKGF
jgi:5-methylcytosine-specific restriction endonuclease McrA